MRILDAIKPDPETVKFYIDAGETPEDARDFAALDLFNKELGGRGEETPLRQWLRNVKQIKGTWDPEVTAEQWTEWLTVRDAYTATLKVEEAKKQAAYSASMKVLNDAQRARIKAEAEGRARADARAKFDAKRRADLARNLQTLMIERPELNPLDWQALHQQKKNPNKAKRDLARRWQECFEALPDNVQTAWLSFHGPISVAMPASGVSDDDADEVAEDGNDVIDDDGARESAIETLAVHVVPLPPGERDIEEWRVDDVHAGVNDPAFRDFMPFSDGVGRLFNLIGNPIDDMILPPANPYTPQAAQDVDAIKDDDFDFLDVVSGILPPGMTIIHGDAKHTKSLLTQKLMIVIADNSGAKFEGIEVEHGPVIYVTLDPGAEAARIKSGILQVRDRLDLKPSGRLHVTDVPLILNEPASVDFWLDLNKARLPAKVIVVDSLFRASQGSLAQDTVVQGCMNGVTKLLQHAKAVAVVHHDNKEGDLFGSKFIRAMLVSKIGVKRNVLKDGVLGNRVTVKVEELKFDTPQWKQSYTLDGPFLNPDATDATAPASAVTGPRPDILEKLPRNLTPRQQVRTAIEPMLRTESRDNEWYKLRRAWKAAGLIEEVGNSIRRL